MSLSVPVNMKVGSRKKKLGDEGKCIRKVEKEREFCYCPKLNKLNNVGLLFVNHMKFEFYGDWMCNNEFIAVVSGSPRLDVRNDDNMILTPS